ncbi:cardiolipin synthase [Stella humosa]|uniref:CDP-diacylglycerol--glycerol-3-phosphate 3-phosphatidyltransferase n=1 Tax=Stella humosa TaxID=94 RepID=A0A3N1L3U5_9PROT|nr:CDP-diacylglycerol--glycerol-3-phosphate 3-phosphatidyltransferase [Stella humosa]ROP84075.1 cardiolipin synthase [Stella humosa]BBK33587.1 CDP-diacylglycerol--glycerol-3-phosphate 3-phosphatidyltransferase [Stella humosa]
MWTNLPNLLTLSRIAVIPVLVATFYFEGPWASYAACVLFTAAALTDWLDGHVARRQNQHSELGRCLDPIADKLLVAAALFMLVAFQRVDGATVLAAVVILCREILVSGLREYLAGLRVGVPVSRLAKWKTGIQMTAIGFLLVGEAGPAFLPVVAIGTIGLWGAAALTLVTGYDYLHTGLRHLQPGAQPPEKPEERQPASGRAR